MSPDRDLDRITNETGDTIMSTTMSDSTITVREFSIDGDNYSANGDLFVQLRNGENIPSGEVEGGIVLVKLNLDGCECNAVEVQRASYGNGREVDAIDAAIEALIVARDALRKMEVAA
jgi:hypothetical protein